VTSARLVSKLNLVTKPHPRAYKLQWLSEDGEVQVMKQVELDISIGKYNDKVCCSYGGQPLNLGETMAI